MDVKTLKDGHVIPQLGFGTYQMQGNTCENAVRHALKVGYRHIDTADFYGNHDAIGRALKDVDREQVFLTTKVWRDHLDYDNVIADVDRFLRELDTDYIDLLLVHWPNKDIPIEETMRAFNKVVEMGRVRSIGVSNFTTRQVEQAIKHSKAPIVMNQVECHPFFFEKKLIDSCQKQGIEVTAYRPIVMGKVNDDPILQEVAQHHKKTPVQIAIRWLLDKGLIVIPRSSKPEHIEENFDVFDFILSDAQKEKVSTLDTGKRLISPAFAEFDE